MALRSILLTSMPGAAKIYSNVVRHALEKRSSPNRILELPQLSLRCLNISLDHDHIQCYSEVCGFGPTPGPVLAPMTYPFVLTFPLQMYLMSDQSFPHPIMGMVHLTNKIEHFGNVTAGKNVDAHVSLSDSYIYHEKGLCFSMTAELFDSKTKKLLWRNESVMLRRMKLTVPESETPFESKIKEADVASLKEIEKWILPSNLGRNAKLFGFQQGAIIHGMWTKARALTTIMKNAPKDIDAFRSYDSSRPASSAYVEFKTPLFLPGEVTLLAEKLQCGVHQISNGEREDKVIFQVKGATADMLPHVRGICSWISA